MLITLKHSQRKIATLVLSMFMGSWVLLFCQTCIAAIEDIDDYKTQKSELSNSCHSSEVDEPITGKDEIINEHCLGACDCAVITATVSSDKSSELAGKIKFSPDLFVYVASEIVLSNRVPLVYRKPTSPDQAILLPYQHYAVLLI
ncbi:MAG: putative metal-binding protein [Gammaproteobacteria bacterium]|jgi:predicted metal-binding protein